MGVNPFDSAISPAFFVVCGLIGLVLLVWYLWAMARLFPSLGLRAGEGWVPIWNEWKLIDRAGLAGWTVLFYFVALGIIPVIVRIIAMHRLNREFGAGGGYTVIGALLPPLWATLFAGRVGAQAATWPQWPAAENQPDPDPLGGSMAPGGGAQRWAADAELPQNRSASLVAPLGGETEAEYARLAAEGFSAPPAVPFGELPPTTPFSWTAASRTQSEPVQFAPPVPPAPPLHPVTSATTSQPQPVATPDEQPEVASPFQPLPAAPAPTAATHKPTGITGMFAAAAANDPRPPAPMRQGDSDDELDRTVVARRNHTTWVLQLPDGSELPLYADTIVGRRPEPRDGAEALTIADPSRTLSKSHARLRFDGNSWSVEDLHSTNGTVLFDEAGREIAAPAGVAVPTVSHMLLGTLEVWLRPGGDPR